MASLKNNPEVKTLLQQAEQKAYAKGLKVAGGLAKEAAKSVALSLAGDKNAVKAAKAVATETASSIAAAVLVANAPVTLA